MKLVYNPSNTSVVYDDEGHLVAPEEWLNVPVTPKVEQLVKDGKLVFVNVPNEMPESVVDEAFQAMREAVDSKPSNTASDRSEDGVSDTGAQQPRSDARKHKSKEA